MTFPQPKNNLSFAYTLYACVCILHIFRVCYNKLPQLEGFLGGSAGKEITCNVGGLGLIPGLGRTPGEGNGYPLQYSWASLVAQLVKNPPAIWETWV